MAQCNYCSLQSSAEDIRKAGRWVRLVPDGDSIALHSYALDACGNSQDDRDEQHGYMALTLHCCCDEDN